MTLNNIDQQIQETIKELEFSLSHFEYSYKKVSKLGLPDLDDLEALESWESFTSRFSRVCDIFCKKLLRSLVLKGDPAFRGSLMDSFNQSEKLGHISDANRWWGIRALRNQEAHDYSKDDIVPFFEKVLKESDFVITEVKSVISKL